ncbi:MAG: hypothetical protein ACI8YQ_005277, partial [Polaribacter sp.]
DGRREMGDGGRFPRSRAVFRKIVYHIVSRDLYKD